MTNRQKFIQVMNEVFNAGLSLENMKPGRCTPCGLFKKRACLSYTCEGCGKWWGKQYEPQDIQNHGHPDP